MNKELYIIRHGETDYNRKGIVQGGGVDSSLNEKGQSQGRAFYENYFHIPFEAVITSKLIRTQQTVKPFLDDGLSHFAYAEINEMGWGDHEGRKPNKAMKKDYEVAREQWRMGNYHHAVANGESIRTVADRILQFFELVETQHPQDLILICCHGRTMRIMMTLLAGLPLSEMENFGHSNTGLYHLTYRGVGNVDFHLKDDISHLQNPKLIIP